MFDIGWTELLVIGVVALIVVGPRDLPGMFRQLGRFTAKARGMAREFSRAMEEAADESGVKDLGKDLKGMTNLKSTGLDKLQDAASSFEKWDPTKKTAATGAKKGPATAAMTEERAEAARKIHEATAKRASERKAAEAAAEATPAAKPKTTKAKAAKPKTAAKKPAAKPKAAAAKKPAAKTKAAPAKTPAAKKAAPKKAAPKKAAAKTAKGT